MTLHPFTTRTSILGLPIGPRGLDWASIIGSAVAVASVLGTLETGLVVKQRLGEVRARWAQRLEEGRELIEEGEEVIHHAANVAHTVSTVANVVPTGGARK